LSLVVWYKRRVAVQTAPLARCDVARQPGFVEPGGGGMGAGVRDTGSVSVPLIIMGSEVYTEEVESVG